MLLSFDTETTGVDVYHGARPFFVTICFDNGQQLYWEWEVDPRTRKVLIPKEDSGEIQEIIEDKRNTIVLQNSKFDVAMVREAGIIKDWPWDRTHDTLAAGHILGSNQPHDLTSMALLYLGENIQPYEDRLEKLVKECRTLAKREFPDWLLAGKDVPSMPSAKEKTWKYDTWLPAAIANRGGTLFPEALQDYKTVLSDYANVDSVVTLHLWQRMEKELKQLDLWDLYLVRLQSMSLACGMEQRGITLSKQRLFQLVGEYKEESQRLGRLCTNIARSYNVALTLPKSGCNQSLHNFIFNPTGLHLKPLKSSLKTGKPSLDKMTLEAYEGILPEKSKALLFVQSLRGKRKRDTALQYMEGYQRYWLQHSKLLGTDTYTIHPSLNPTGTDTLRWSSSNPNEQNISKSEGFNIRYCFGPAPGREWWSLDAQNIELRIPFYECGEKVLIDLFERPNDPPYYGSNHLANCHAVYPDIWAALEKEVGFEKVGPEFKKRYKASYYQFGKNGGFCKQYGGQRAKTDATFKRAGAFDLLEEKFGNLAELNRNLLAFANKHGYVETMPDKTVNPKRGYPLLCTRTENGRILPTVPLSYHVQGTAMWWTLKAMIRTEEQLTKWKREGFNAWIALQVHDEIVFDLPARANPKDDPKGSNLARVKVLANLMAMGGDDLGLPTPVGIEYHENNWSEGVTL